MSIAARPYDIIIWGSTGFTGRLAANYLAANYPQVRFAIAGRNADTLNDVKRRLAKTGNGEKVSVLIADINDPQSLDAVFKQGKVVLSTAGPFAKIGTPVVESCVRSATHYCDITGEPQWISTLIDNLHEEAVKKRLRITNCCGFDCIPSDLSTQMLLDTMEQRSLTPTEVRLTAYDMKGGASGGTCASMLNIFESSTLTQLKAMANPYMLNPRDPATKKIIQPTNAAHISQASDCTIGSYDAIERCWVMPYIMQGIDTRIVNRSIHLAGRKGAMNIIYSERMRAPNVFGAILSSLLMPIVGVSLFVPFIRNMLKWILPKPGSGPSEAERESGYFKMRIWGKGTAADGKAVTVRGGITAMNGDPGYKQTAMMVVESALCLAFDEPRLPQTFGILTPSVAMGPVLRQRLQDRGMDFFITAADQSK